ncbi:MAG: tRNA (adenosine(37)-N6)-threonylcarbamoyltransferase complex transferase subunit TsaD [Deltaproteobacteria bacterium]
MIVLGVETSCDDTAVATVEDGTRVLSSVVSSQDSIHQRFGGIVPELASRRHIEAILHVADEALKEAGLTLDRIDGIAVTEGPGLVGSILIGVSFAKSVSLATGAPFTGVNHIEAHAHAAFLSSKDYAETPPDFPFVALIASGGHTTLILFTGFTEYKVLGSTLDDAAGEAFDKVSKLLGLGYPGGATIDRLAKSGDRTAFEFKRPYIARRNLDFSFSGIKTAALNIVKNIVLPEGRTQIPEQTLKDIAASFQEAAVDVLVAKSMWALEKTGAKTLVVAGGVACNSRLRQRLEEASQGAAIRVVAPPPRFCTDNGATIASLGFFQLKKGVHASLDMNARPTWQGF